MKRHLILLLAIAISCGATSGSWAQAPNFMNYQGKLTQPDGNALTPGNYTLEINIYDAASAGTKVWGPFLFDGTSGNGKAPQVTVLTGGRFNVIVGQNDTAARNLQDVFKNNGSRFVELKVNAGSPILPRQQFLSAPYAIRASQADNAALLNNKPSTDFANNYSGLTTYGVPTGTIVMWHGASIPAGWVLCNGNNGTPNLQDRFPVAAGSGYGINATGGASTHTHTYSGRTGDPTTFEGYVASYNDNNEVGNNDHKHDYSGTTVGTSNLPPYHALYFIMKQ